MSQGFQHFAINAVCLAFLWRACQKQLTTSDRKTGWGHPCFHLLGKEMEVLRGVLFAIETEEKKQNSTFSLRP